ncbi:hypothetical protein HanPI659440_Chr12g0447451 [Helianthus annuus]|nr:hypothetical protein HanPI659440_Chr12g0447451 [Helianthus annuus]
MLTGISKRNEVGKEAGKVLKIDDGLEVYKNLVGFALVMRFKDLAALKRVSLVLKEMDAGEGRVQYPGSLSVLVSFKRKEEAEQVFLLAKEDVGCFAAVSRWEGQSLEFKRLAWIKIRGIPVHLLHSSVIDKVAEMFGKIMHRPTRSEEDADLSNEYIGVLVGEGRRIVDEVTVVWRERRYKVWVEEESGDWVPEFIDDDQEKDCNTNEDCSEQEADENRNSGPDGDEELAGNFDADKPVAGDCTTINGATTVSDVIMETNNVSLKGAELKEGSYEGDFLPGHEFDFEKDLIIIILLMRGELRCLKLVRERRNNLLTWAWAKVYYNILVVLRSPKFKRSLKVGRVQ